MELAPQEEILRLTNSLERGAPRNAGRPRRDTVARRAVAKPLTTKPAADAAATGTRGHYCKCGQCRVCVQNAEWDAKFNQKFGESMRDYYSGTRLTRRASWWSEM